MFESILQEALTKSGVTVVTKPIIPTKQTTRYALNLKGPPLMELAVVAAQSFVDGFKELRIKYAYVEPILQWKDDEGEDVNYYAVWVSKTPMIEQTTSSVDQYIHDILAELKIKLDMERSFEMSDIPPFTLKTFVKDYLVPMIEQRLSHL
jgi:hypothetical protein